MRALLVEDEVRIARKVTDALASAGYASPSGSGRSAPLAVTHPERQPLGDDEGVARHALGEQAQIRHPPRFRQRSGEVTFGGRLIDRLLGRCQPPGQRHVEEPGAQTRTDSPSGPAARRARASAARCGGVPVPARTEAREASRAARRRHPPAPATAGRGASRARPGSHARRPLRAAAGRTARCAPRAPPPPAPGRAIPVPSQPHRRLQRGMKAV